MQSVTSLIFHGLPMGTNFMDMDLGDLNANMAMEESATQDFAPTHPGGEPADSNTSTRQTMGNNSMITGVGAGPLPTGFGVQNPSSTGSTLTEFTKRRNWSKLLLEELRDLMMILSPDGRIQHVSQSVKLLTGYEGYTLMGQLVSDYVHNEDKSMFIREFNESIASGIQMRFFYRFRKEDDTYAIFEAFGHPHLTSDALVFGNGGLPYCRGYFMMSRPYPTKNAALLDSFLEHKIENERLLKRIAELKQEEEEEEEETELMLRQEGQSTLGYSTGRDSGNTAAHSGSDAMPPPARPKTNNALTAINLSQAQARARPDSISDKMARYEGANPVETIEMLTGLKYHEGERSLGLSTGAASPALIQGDAGIAIFADRDNRSNMDRKKKTKVADEYVCTDCGTLDSPEWRKGPNGPKTLCNACGCKLSFRWQTSKVLMAVTVVRWAKKEKKRQQQNKLPPMLKHSSTES
jgi:PAS domain S-box-containing protein